MKEQGDSCVVQWESGEPVMVSLLTLLEMEWVLRSSYALQKEDIAATISSLLDAVELTFEDEPSVEEALSPMEELGRRFR